MKAKLERLKRIEQLQRRLHELSDWRLMALGQQRNQLTDAHLQMLNATNADLFAFGAPAAVATRRIRAIEIEIESAKRVYEAQAKRTLEHGARSHLAGRALKAASAQNQRDQQNRSLAELIEVMLHAGSSASRKA
jgi:hypothetical protein